jgi:hypothetical protein
MCHTVAARADSQPNIEIISSSTLGGTHVHVRSSRDAHVATCASRLKRTCTCVSDRGPQAVTTARETDLSAGAAKMLVHGEEQSSAPRRQAKRRKGAPKSSASRRASCRQRQSN